jgi:hypothetical protein
VAQDEDLFSELAFPVIPSGSRRKMNFHNLKPGGGAC